MACPPVLVLLTPDTGGPTGGRGARPIAEALIPANAKTLTVLPSEFLFGARGRGTSETPDVEYLQGLKAIGAEIGETFPDAKATDVCLNFLSGTDGALMPSAFPEAKLFIAVDSGPFAASLVRPREPLAVPVATGSAWRYHASIAAATKKRAS